MNATNQPLVLKAGEAVGTYTAVAEEDIERQLADTVHHVRQEKPLGQPGGQVPEHLRTLYEAAVDNCSDSREAHSLRALLCQYSSVFSTGDQDMGKTELVEHSIPLVPGARPFRQAPHRLGPAKEFEAEKQVRDLRQRGLIEPGQGAWSSPVVLVRKKDGTWKFASTTDA
jgi:hypothetical protein